MDQTRPYPTTLNAGEPRNRGKIRYFLLLTLVLGLVACDPEDVVDVSIDPPQVVEDAVNGVQQGVDGLNDAVQNLGEGAGGGEEGAEDGGESEDEGN